SRRRHTRFSRDWSSDVCSSDLILQISLAAIGSDLKCVADLNRLERRLAQNDLVAVDRLDPREIPTNVIAGQPAHSSGGRYSRGRSEERRVGKECKSTR